MMCVTHHAGGSSLVKKSIEKLKKRKNTPDFIGTSCGGVYFPYLCHKSMWID